MHSDQSMDGSSLALLELGRLLRAQHYQFTTVTPETQRRVNGRWDRLGDPQGRTLRDVFGWNRPFKAEFLPRGYFDLLRAADALEPAAEQFRSRVRFSSRGSALFVHSSFPTRDANAVFFGPDSYRFCNLLERWAPACKRLIDIGCGTGIGGISLAHKAVSTLLTDVNPRALYMAQINAALNDVQLECVASDVLRDVRGDADLIIANPPYMRDASARLYRDGGGRHGEALSVRIVREGLARLASGGTLIVYTGSAIVAGEDTFLHHVTPLLQEQRLRFEYEELDPDVFGDELDAPGYENVERIAVVGLRVFCN